MDPQAAWDDVIEGMVEVARGVAVGDRRSGARRQVVEALRALAEWLEAGGFPPDIHKPPRFSGELPAREKSP